jgi:hypothetical protein
MRIQLQPYLPRQVFNSSVPKTRSIPLVTSEQEFGITLSVTYRLKVISKIKERKLYTAISDSPYPTPYLWNIHKLVIIVMAI